MNNRIRFDGRGLSRLIMTTMPVGLRGIRRQVAANEIHGGFNVIGRDAQLTGQGFELMMTQLFPMIGNQRFD